MNDVFSRVANRAASAAARASVVFENHADLAGYTGLCIVVGGLVALFGERERMPLTVAYALSGPFMFGLPVLMVVRHCLRQARVMTRLRALYAVAEVMTMSGRYADARCKLTSIKRWELHWRIGNSFLYRAAYGAIVMASTFLAAMLHYTLYLHEYHSHKSFGETVEMMIAKPADTAWYMGFALLASLSAIAHLRDLAEEPWALFYSAKLRSMLDAGRAVAAPRRQARARSTSEANARELFGLSATFTHAELRRAWLRMVRELHPDRWAHAGDAVRGAKEAALKRVNAARDELMAQAVA